MHGFAEIFHTCLEMMIAYVNAPFMARSVGNAGREERTIEPLKASTGKDVAGAHGRFDGAHRTAEVDILDRLFPVVDVLFLRAAETLFLQAINRWELFPKKGP